jgi:hypothetical protein
VVSPGISQDEQPRLEEGLLDLIGERSGGVAPGNGLRPRVGGKLEHRALAVGAGRLHADVLGVLNGHNHARRQLKLLPCLAQVDDVDSW